MFIVNRRSDTFSEYVAFVTLIIFGSCVRTVEIICVFLALVISPYSLAHAHTYSGDVVIYFSLRILAECRGKRMVQLDSVTEHVVDYY